MKFIKKMKINLVVKISFNKWVIIILIMINKKKNKKINKLIKLQIKIQIGTHFIVKD